MHTLSDLGEVLRRARLEKGLSLDELTEVTKIQKRYLEAVEDGNFDMLPGAFYTRAFIKNYADHVGLDSSQLLAQYMQAVPRTEIDHYANLKRTRPTVKRQIRWDGWLSKLLLFSFIGLICVVIYVFYVNKDDANTGEAVDSNKINQGIGVTGEDEEVNPPDESDEGGSDETDIDEPAPALTEPQLTLLSKDENVYIYEISNVDAVNLELVTKDRFWYEAFKLKDNGEQGDPISDALLASGQTLTFSDINGIYIRSAAFLATDFNVNGQPIDTSVLSSNTKIFIKKGATAPQ